MTNDPAFKALPPAEASTVYRQILGTVTAYLEEMEVPRPMIDAMVRTGSSEIEWVDEHTSGLRRPASIAEWEDASCGSFTSEERSTFYELGVKKNMSSQEQRFLRMLYEKLNKDVECKDILRSSQRDRLAFPGTPLGEAEPPMIDTRTGIPEIACPSGQVTEPCR